MPENKIERADQSSQPGTHGAAEEDRPILRSTAEDWNKSPSNASQKDILNDKPARIPPCQVGVHLFQIGGLDKVDNGCLLQQGHMINIELAQKLVVARISCM
jgi:hypothetical protein